jgi:hypothetical protein
MVIVMIENLLYHYHYLYLFSLLNKVNNVNQDLLVQVKIKLLRNYFDGMIVLLIDDILDFDVKNDDENMDLLMMIHLVNKQNRLLEDQSQYLKLEDDLHLPRKKKRKKFFYKKLICKFTRRRGNRCNGRLDPFIL